MTLDEVHARLISARLGSFYSAGDGTSGFIDYGIAVLDNGDGTFSVAARIHPLHDDSRRLTDMALKAFAGVPDVIVMPSGSLDACVPPVYVPPEPAFRQPAA